MSTKKPIDPIVAEYRKTRKRVLQRIRRERQKGKEVSVQVPTIPKDITPESIKELESYTFEYIRQRESESQATQWINIDEDFVIERRRQDEEAKRKLMEDEMYNVFNEGLIVLNRVEEMIDNYANENPRAADWLRKELDAAIRSYGQTLVVTNLGLYEEEAIEAADKQLKYKKEGGKSDENSMFELGSIITRGLTAEQMRGLQDAIDSDNSY